jgi:hypothetical protein
MPVAGEKQIISPGFEASMSERRPSVSTDRPAEHPTQDEQAEQSEQAEHPTQDEQAEQSEQAEYPTQDEQKEVVRDGGSNWLALVSLILALPGSILLADLILGGLLQMPIPGIDQLASSLLTSSPLTYFCGSLLLGIVALLIGMTALAIRGRYLKSRRMTALAATGIVLGSAGVILTILLLISLVLALPNA